MEAGTREKVSSGAGVSREERKVVEDAVGEVADDQSKLSLRAHDHTFEFYLKWVGKSLEGFEQGRALI